MKLKIQSRGLRSEMSPRALEKWNPAIQAAVESTSDTITIYGVIGEDWYGEGVTLKRIDAALRAIGEQVREAARQHHRLFRLAVVIEAELDTVLVDAVEQ